MSSSAFQKSNLALKIIGVLSVLIIGFLFWLIYFQEGTETSPALVVFLPTCNALFNSISACFILLGYKAIKSKNIILHKKMMISAFVSSTLFFISYTVYHAFHGDTYFQGYGIVRPIYFFILISHILLSVALVPLILSSFYFALSQKINLHKKVVKFTLPIWLYVSITGVLIYFFLKIFS